MPKIKSVWSDIEFLKGCILKRKGFQRIFLVYFCDEEIISASLNFKGNLKKIQFRFQTVPHFEALWAPEKLKLTFESMVCNRMAPYRPINQGKFNNKI